MDRGTGWRTQEEDNTEHGESRNGSAYEHIDDWVLPERATPGDVQRPVELSHIVSSSVQQLGGGAYAGAGAEGKLECMRRREDES